MAPAQWKIRSLGGVGYKRGVHVWVYVFEFFKSVGAGMRCAYDKTYI